LVWFLYKKITKLIKKTKTIKTGSNQLVSVRFSFLEQKPVQADLTQFGSVFSGFFCSGFFVSSL
jgi:hypothetical protein